MFQFPGFASRTYGFSAGYRIRGGLPHSDIHGSKPARGSPWLFAACHVLLRLLTPRHPPNALLTLDPNHPSQPNSTLGDRIKSQVGQRPVDFIRYKIMTDVIQRSKPASPQQVAEHDPCNAHGHVPPLAGANTSKASSQSQTTKPGRKRPSRQQSAFRKINTQTPNS
jgi:hypothetical protein